MTLQEKALTALAGLLSPGDPLVLAELIECLTAAGPKARASLLPALEKLLYAEDPGTRAAAAKAITTMEERESPRVMAVMADLITEKILPQDLRLEALGRVHERNPAALAKVTPALIRQLGDPSADVRRAALELLSQIIEDTPARLPDRSDDR
jgi:HEAT repeat protein